MIHCFFWKRGNHLPDVLRNPCVTQLLRLYVLYFPCRGHKDNSLRRRYNMMWSVRTTVKALRGTDKQRITSSNDTSNTSRQNSNSKIHSSIMTLKVRQCKDCRNSPGLKVYMLRKNGIKLYFNRRYLNGKGGAWTFSLPSHFSIL